MHVWLVRPTLAHRNSALDRDVSRPGTDTKTQSLSVIEPHFFITRSTVIDLECSRVVHNIPYIVPTWTETLTDTVTKLGR